MTHPTDEALIEQMARAIGSQMNATGYIDESDNDAWDRDTTLAATATLAIARKAIEAEMRGEWRDISTAPKDDVLLYFAETKEKHPLPAMMKVGRVSDYPYRPPKAWQPLPLPPKEPV